MEQLFSVVFSTAFFYSILRVTTPILFAAMGAVVANRAGIPNIALEGIMLISAFTGMFASALTHSGAIGLLAAVAIGIAVAGILAFFTLYYRTNVILGGIAINSLASGGTVFALYLFAHDKGTSASIASEVVPQINIPLLKDIPILGEIFSGHNLLTYLAILSVVVVFLMLKKTPLG
ncbi:MAG: ABC transporter permease, partial [Pseudoflavonifractor sp.]